MNHETKTPLTRLGSILLAAALSLNLTACRDKNGAADLAFQTSPYYALEEMPVPADTGQLGGCCTDGASVWYLAVQEEGGPSVLCRVPLDGGEAEVLPEYRSPAVDGAPAVGYVGPILGGDGKLWVWEQFFVSAEEGQSGNSQAFHIRRLDPDTGGELGAADITAAMEDMDLLSLNGMAVDGDGTVFLADKKHIVALDSQGQTLYTLKAKLPDTFFSAGAGGSLALLPDGTIGAVMRKSNDERTVKAIDRETRDWTGEEYPLHKNVDRIFSGRGPCAYYYIADRTVYGVIPGEEIPLRLLPWSNAQLDQPGSVMCFALLEEGQAAILLNEQRFGANRYSAPIQAMRLLPTDEVPEGGRVKLVYGTIGANSFIKNEMIDKFNKRSKEYYIEYRDYSEGVLGWSGEKNTPVYQSALARLYTDMSAGQGPDILDRSVPLDALAEQGALEDLWPWIDSDPDISREDLLIHVLECMEVDGKLPRICNGFKIETAVAGAAVAGDRTGWTMEEMVAAFGGEMPEFYFTRKEDDRLIYPMFYRFDRSSTLYYLVNMNLSRYVDAETGECAFDGEEFKALLQMVGSGADAAETGLDISDPLTRYNLGLSGDTIMGNVEACRVFPWEGKPLLYGRSLADCDDLLLDDVLFGGRALLPGYEQRLWDAGIVTNLGFTNYSPDHEVMRPIYYDDRTKRDWNDNGVVDIECARYGVARAPLAADCAVGMADGNIYASYVGFPTENRTGSSFTLSTTMGISAASKEKEGAWAFVRGLLLPGSNINGWYFPEAGGGPSHYDGFSINKETFAEQMRLGPDYWTDPYSGEVFTDADGKPVEFSKDGMAVGYPGDIVLMAYLFKPTEAQMDRFWKLYESTEQITGRNDALLDIVIEQAQPYFAGDKGLDETVGLIQNRAALYINETR